MTKVILAIVSAETVTPLTNALVEKRYAVTQISSLGGFRRRGNTTLVIGVEEAQVEPALGLIRDTCRPLTKPDFHAATIFVLEANQFVQI